MYKYREEIQLFSFIFINRATPLQNKLGGQLFLTTIKVEPRWAEKIAHPTNNRLSRLEIISVTKMP